MISFLTSLLSFLKTTTGKVLAVLVIGWVLGFMTHMWWVKPEIQLVQIPGKDTVRTYYVDKPTLSADDILKLVGDKTEVAKLLKQQQALGQQVATLTETIHNLQSTGAGKVTYVDRWLPGNTQVVKEASFKDWRLSFKAIGEDASYILSQRFETLATTGKDKTGKPTADVKLFEIGPGDTRTELFVAKQTNVFATPGKRWFFSPTLQAGGLLAFDTHGNRKPGALVGLQWLKRGMSKAAEDSLYSLLTPVFVGTETYREVGILPFSVNLGRAPYQPFRDLWLSPYIGKDKHYGIAITASF